MYDSANVEILAHAECDQMLHQTHIGRFVFRDGETYAVHPVRYLYDGRRLLFRTDNAAKVKAAAQHQVVSFEIDDIDQDSGQGWSVIATGAADRVTDPYDIERTLKLLPRPWTSCDGTEVVCVHVNDLEGRRSAGATHEPVDHPRRNQSTSASDPTIAPR